MAKSGLKTVTRLRKYLNGVPTLETKANVEGDEDYIAPYLSLESCPIKAEDITTTSTTTTTTTTTTTNSQGKVPVCLAPEAAVGVDNGVLLFGKGSTTNTQYKVGMGKYKITAIPISHPIAFLNNGVSNFTYTGSYPGGTKVASDGNTYTYYWGTITITVTGSFSPIDYECYNHGYMGGQDNMTYDATCIGITTTPAPQTTLKQGSIKTWQANNYQHTSNTVDLDKNTFSYICNQPNTGYYAGNYVNAGFQGTGTHPKAGDYVMSSVNGYVGRQFTSTSSKYVFRKIHDQQKVLVIRNEDGKVIKVKNCASSALSAATQSLYLSRGVKRLQDLCGSSWLISNQTLVEPSTTTSSLSGKTVFDNSVTFDGKGLYYVPQLDSSGTFDGNSRFEWIKISSNGVIAATGSYRGCIGGGVAPENIH